jgi:dihydrofolate reductase
MGKIVIEKSMSLDGFITGPNPTPENPLGDGGGAIFGWMMAAQPEEPKADGTHELCDEYQEEIGSHIDATGAVIMGKRMWEMIYGPQGWVAPDGTAFPWPVFVLTHEVRDPETCGATRFTYVTDGPESALAQAKAVAGERNIGIAGGTYASSSSPRGWSTRWWSMWCRCSSAMGCGCSMGSAAALRWRSPVPSRATAWSTSPFAGTQCRRRR